MGNALRLDIVVHASPVDQALLASISALLGRVITNQEVMKMDIQGLKDQLAGLATDIAAEKAEVQALLTDLKTQIQALKDQIAAGTVVTQADLDALSASIATIDAGVKDISEPAPPGP